MLKFSIAIIASFLIDIFVSIFLERDAIRFHRSSTVRINIDVTSPGRFRLLTNSIPNIVIFF